MGSTQVKEVKLTMGEYEQLMTHFAEQPTKNCVQKFYTLLVEARQRMSATPAPAQSKVASKVVKKVDDAEKKAKELEKKRETARLWRAKQKAAREIAKAAAAASTPPTAAPVAAPIVQGALFNG